MKNKTLSILVIFIIISSGYALLKLYVNKTNIVAIIQFANKVPKATPNTFKFKDNTKKELKTMFKTDKTIISKLDILVF